VRGEATPVVTEEQLISETARYLKDRRYEDLSEAIRAAREFVEFCKGRAWVFSEIGSTAEGDPLFTFSHRTFLEYFAAAHLSSINDTPERLARTLAPHIVRQEWDVVAQLALQIKNRTTQDGAVRFYMAQLNTRRYTAPNAIGNLLSFLSRCLTFLELPPRIIRELADRCLDHLIVDPRDKKRLTPMGYLMTHDSIKQPVADRITEGLHSIIQGKESSSKYIAALHLLFVLGAPLRESSKPDATLDQELNMYWFDTGYRLADNYREQIVNSAATDMSLMSSAYRKGWITARELGGNSRAALQTMFEGRIPTGVSSSYWLDLASSLVLRYMEGSKYRTDRLVYVNAQLEEVTDIIKDLGQPPWAPSLASTILFDRTEYGTPVPISKKAWTAVVLLVAMIFEASNTKSSGTLEFARSGQLARMLPYLECRESDSNEGPRDSLDIDGEFEELLSKWAVRQLNFVDYNSLWLGSDRGMAH
jgi:hypothetical protein